MYARKFDLFLRTHHCEMIHILEEHYCYFGKLVDHEFSAWVARPQCSKYFGYWAMYEPPTGIFLEKHRTPFAEIHQYEQQCQADSSELTGILAI